MVAGELPVSHLVAECVRDGGPPQVRLPRTEIRGAARLQQRAVDDADGLAPGAVRAAYGRLHSERERLFVVQSVGTDDSVQIDSAFGGGRASRIRIVVPVPRRTHREAADLNVVGDVASAGPGPTELGVPVWEGMDGQVRRGGRLRHGLLWRLGAWRRGVRSCAVARVAGRRAAWHRPDARRLGSGGDDPEDCNGENKCNRCAQSDHVAPAPTSTRRDQPLLVARPQSRRSKRRAAHPARR